jgi:TRAP-type C4-dicarboxylate transport system permease small subunit
VETLKKVGLGIYNVMGLIQKYLAIVICISVPAIVVYQVILRYVFKAPLMGIEELLVFFIIWLYMIGGAVASKERTHISCGILTLYMKRPLTIKLFNVAKAAFGVVCCAWITKWGWWYFTYSLNLWKTSDILKIPMFYGESAVFVGFALMLVYTFVEMCENIIVLAKYLKEVKTK